MKYKLFFIQLVFLLLINSSFLFSQRGGIRNLPNYDDKFLHFGYTVGVNSLDFRILNADNFFNIHQFNEIYGVENRQTVGIHLGIISNLRLNEYLDLRVLFNLTFGQRDLLYYVMQSDSVTIDTYKMKIATSYLEFPILLKYKAERIGNFRPYVIAGVNPKYDLAARKKPKDDELPKLQLKTFDPCYELGAGIDLYTNFFKFAIELKYSVGIYNLLQSDGTQYSSSMKKLSSQVFMLSFHFE